MKKIKFTRETIALTLIAVLSSILNFTNIGIEGYGNQYYSAGVKSMTMSLKNFFFVSFDPAGFVSIDKPPVGFWIQAISAKIFGFSGWSLMLPEAAAGVISVILIYHIVKRSFGTSAGLLSALFLAVTPIFVAVSRINTIDNLLVMTLLFACWALLTAAEKGKLKYLILSLALVGVGFNIKMLQAYMVIPAIYITYLIANTISVKKRIMNLIIGTIVLAAVSLSWAAAVDLTPSSSRPYVGSSTNNTVMELIIGHNGLERLGLSGNGSSGGGNGKVGGQMPSGQRNGADWNPGTAQNQQGQSSQNGSNNNTNGFPGTPPNQSGQNYTEGSTNSSGQQMPANPPNDGQGMKEGPFNEGGGRPNGTNMKAFNGRGGAGGSGSNFGGNENASIIRLFSNNGMSDQIMWLFPLALFGFAAAAVKEKLKLKFDNERKLSIVLWLMWLLPAFIYFSFTTGLFHPYYLTMLAPPIAALAGIGTVTMWQMYKEGGWKAWLLPAALIVNGLLQLLLLYYYYNTSIITRILIVIASVLCIIPSIMLMVINLLKNKESFLCEDITRFKKTLAIIAVTGLLAAPAVWSGTTLIYPESGTFPSAGLELISNRSTGIGSTDNVNDSTTTKLIQYLKANKTNEKYMVAVPSANSYASEIIIQSGESVMTLGGFSGSDNILTLEQFKKLVSDGQVRYAVIGGGEAGNNEITNWIQQNGKSISESEWNGSSSTNNTSSSSNNNTNFQRDGGFGGGSVQLYDLKSAAD